MEDTMPEISQVEYDRLKSAARKLEALEYYGVDNWQGYSEAMQSANEEAE